MFFRKVNNMISIISFIAYIIAAILHFNNGKMTLFYMSVILLIITYAVNSFVRHYRVGNLRKIFDDAVGQMEADGATEDDIQVYAENTKVDKSLLNYPEWIKVVVILSVLASFVLLVIGIM